MKTVGFIGLGTMGLPMATHLLHSGIALTVWNRTKEKATSLIACGAKVANDPTDLFQQSEVIIIMLANPAAIDEVLGPGTELFSKHLSGKILVNMGTNPPEYSRKLQTAIQEVGGHYIEAPVSGSRRPAENGELICMIAGPQREKDIVRPILMPLCKDLIECGSVPDAILMKLAVNIFLINSVTGLAESLSFARAQNLDLKTLVTVLNSSQMASSISRLKSEKFLNDDYTKQAAISDVLYNARLIEGSAKDRNIEIPLLNKCLKLYEKAQNQGHGHEDMISVVKAFLPSFEIENLSAFIKSWLESWTGNQPEKLLSFYSPTAFYRDPFCPQGLTGENLHHYFRKLLKKNPNWKWEASEIIPTPRGAVLKWKASIPLGKETKIVEGMDILEIEGGHIARNEVYFDLSALEVEE